MSGTSKRLQEEGSNPTTSKRPLEESGLFSSLSGKLTQSVANDFYLPFEPGQDGRLAKVQRIESRFVDKRPSLLHRMSSSSNNSSLDHTYTSEPRTELRDSKDARDFRTEKRETKAETRELYTEPTVDPLGSKADIRPDNRVGEKELRSDRQSHSDFKGDTKLEKDSYTVQNSHLNWKEPKENHRSKRYSEFPSESLDTWRISRHVLHNTDEVRKDTSIAEERDFLEAPEAVGENKVDSKGEDKFRDKDRKRKDEKHGDCGEREKERNDRRNNLLLGGPSNERKEMAREEKDVDKWERERKDAQKDKERKDREKEPIKRELSNASEKENLHNDKEQVDGSVKFPEQESTMLEAKGLHDDGWKALGRELNDKKRERDVDVEGDTPEKRNRCYDKESDDGCAEGDGVTERDIEAFGHQRRRMLRSRGTSQTPHREPRFRSRARHNEGSQVEVSTIVYKAGLCMQELLKSWKEFEASQDDTKEESLQNGPTLEIRIPAEYVIATNRQVRGGQLWGTDVYTNDSDLVAVLMHTGYCRPTSSPPPSSISELQATIRVLPPKDCYTSTLRNNVRSRAWGAGIGCSFCVERCCIVKKGGGTINLEPRLTHISAVEPTLAPVSVERTMTTRSAASNASRQQRCVREVTIQYNLCNEPWLKYSISIVADKGLKKPLYTSARLKKGEVLYLETHFKRYELCFNGEKAACNGTMSGSSQATEAEQEKLQNHNLQVQAGDRSLTDRENIIDVFRWSQCKKPLPQTVMRSIGIPLPTEHLEVLEESLDWEDIQWSQIGVWVAGKEYPLARVHFLSPN